MLDAHIHVQDVDEPQRQELVNDAGAVRFFCNATSPADWDAVAALADAHTNVVPFFGVHPWFVDGCEDGWDARLETLIASRPCGVGETGLDKTDRAGDFCRQKEFLRTHLMLAKKCNRPVTIHCVRAWGTLIDILEKAGAAELTFLVHWFAGPADVLGKLIRLGAYISVCVSHSDEQKMQLLDTVPPEKLLIESDYPYFSKRYTGSTVHADALAGVYAFCAHHCSLPEDVFKQRIAGNGSVFTDRAAAR